MKVRGEKKLQGAIFLPRYRNVQELLASQSLHLQMHYPNIYVVAGDCRGRRNLLFFLGRLIKALLDAKRKNQGATGFLSSDFLWLLHQPSSNQ